MNSALNTTRLKYLLFVLFSSVLVTTSQAQVLEKEKVVAATERAFQKAAQSVTGSAPGCALGVSLEGRSVFEKAFGMAEIEHGIPNTPETIFESGSVAKQFTAASIVLLSLENKLSLDDPVKKYIPELPDYGSPLTIRHLLNHTAGLRDFGSVLALTGVGRGSRVVSQELAFDVIVHQQALDFTPGAEYSYSNSGYTLLATIVERVSKQKFPAFTDEKFFKPLGMTNSSWRDDYQRLVKGRAQAYSRRALGAPWRLEMPIMNVYGNGGMLTTVGDWLKWNAMLDSRSMGAPLVAALETVGVLNDGRKITYALGVVVDQYRDMRQVSHSGATAGYQTYLTRLPDQKLSVAVLCNGPTPASPVLANGVLSEIFGPAPTPPQPESVEMKAEELQKYVGLWRDLKTHSPITSTLENGVLKFNGRPASPQKDGSFMLGTSRITFKFGPDGKPVSGERNADGDISRVVADPEWKPTPAELNQFAGEWYSEEAQSYVQFVVEGDKAFIVQRPTTKLPAKPLYKDHFATENFVLWVTRDASGMIDKLHVGGSRLRDITFVRSRR